MLIRQSRGPLTTLFKSYAGSSLVGVGALIAVGVALQLAGLPVTDYSVMGIVLISPFLVGLLLR
jgi:hypothetical protein